MCSILSKLSIISYIFVNSFRDAGHFLGSAGHFWHAGHGLGTADLRHGKTHHQKRNLLQSYPPPTNLNSRQSSSFLDSVRLERVNRLLDDVDALLDLVFGDDERGSKADPVPVGRLRKKSVVSEPQAEVPRIEFFINDDCVE
jgi:hypothetical protein